MKKAKVRKLRRLVEQWTRAEVMARHCPFSQLEFIDYANKEVVLRNKIRKFLFGTSDLVKLGYKWNLPIGREKKDRTYAQKNKTKKFSKP